LLGAAVPYLSFGRSGNNRSLFIEPLAILGKKL